jgi:hypothetical protein
LFEEDLDDLVFDTLAPVTPEKLGPVADEAVSDSGCTCSTSI